MNFKCKHTIVKSNVYIQLIELHIKLNYVKMTNLTRYAIYGIFQGTRV